MVKSLFIGILVGLFICGIGWFFLGRNNLGSIQAIAKEISDSNKQSKRAGDTLRSRYDNLAGTITRLDTQSTELRTSGYGLSDGIGDFSDKAKKLGSGISNTKTAVDRIERRNRQIVSIVGELRKVNESFYERVEKNTK